MNPLFADKSGKKNNMTVHNDDIRPDADSANGDSLTNWALWADSQWTMDGGSSQVDYSTKGFNNNKAYQSYKGGMGFQPSGAMVYKPKPRQAPRRAKGWRENNFWFIGDVHGNFAEYQKAIKDIHEIDKRAITIQVGDLDLKNGDEIPNLGENNWFIQGNHDDIDACKKHPNFMGKYGFKDGVFFMGGAKSGRGGYKNEELSDKDLEAAIKLYSDKRPEIVVTHQAPQSIHEDFMCKNDKSRTGEALEKMWQLHNPHVWAYGHYHWGHQEVYDGCNFIACGPLESHQIRLAWVDGVIEYQAYSKPMEMTKGKAIKEFLGGMFG